MKSNFLKVFISICLCLIFVLSLGACKDSGEKLGKHNPEESHPDYQNQYDSGDDLYLPERNPSDGSSSGSSTSGGNSSGDVNTSDDYTANFDEEGDLGNESDVSDNSSSTPSFSEPDDTSGDTKPITSAGPLVTFH